MAARAMQEYSSTSIALITGLRRPRLQSCSSAQQLDYKSLHSVTNGRSAILEAIQLAQQYLMHRQQGLLYRMRSVLVHP
jgi:hypothetical protein